MGECETCKTISRLLGKRYLMPLLGHEYRKLSLAEIVPQTNDLHLEIVGGLAERGWTKHDIDVVGERSNIETFSRRMRAGGIPHPIHYCGDGIHHSHLRCAFNGIKLALTGRGY